MKYLGVVALIGLLGAVPATAVTISEIMYDPASTLDGDWEWVELHNPGVSAVNLAGYVIDDINAPAHAGSNIAGGSIPAGGFAVLYDADSLSAATFTATWGPGINLVPVTGWGTMGLNNTGDTVGLWNSFASYNGDNQTHANVIAGVAYDDSSPWPSNDGVASIYLTNVAADPSNGANWALSVSGVAGAYTSNPAGVNLAVNVGSPGVIPEASTYLLFGLGALGLMVWRRRKR